jgi:DNA-binding MarR family transcriptional regulator
VELYAEEYNSYATTMKEMSVTPPNRIEWLRDLIGLEIVLWDRINARLKEHHNLSLAFFETLYFIGQASDGSLRIGDLARALRITVGATSKLVDRVETAGLIRRELDADDRRASRVALTDAGRQRLADASITYTAELAAVLDATLAADEQQHLHTLIKRLLAAVENGEAV